MTAPHQIHATPEELKRLRGGTLSIESDYGYHNWDDLHLPGLPTQQDQTAMLRVSHVISTGDLYATPAIEEAPAALLGRVRDHEGALMHEREVHSLLWDWAETGPGRPLSWFVQRIQHINRDPQGPQETRALRHAVLLHLTERIAPVHQNTLQAVVYLSQALLNLPTGYRWRIHHHAPWSQELQDDIATLASLGYLQANPDPRYPGDLLTPGDAPPPGWTDPARQHRARLDRATRLFHADPDANPRIEPAIHYVATNPRPGVPGRPDHQHVVTTLTSMMPRVDARTISRHLRRITEIENRGQRRDPTPRDKAGPVLVEARGFLLEHLRALLGQEDWKNFQAHIQHQPRPTTRDGRPLAFPWEYYAFLRQGETRESHQPPHR